MIHPWRFAKHKKTIERPTQGWSLRDNQRYFRDLTFFSADSELISSDFLWNSAVQNWKIRAVQRWSALFHKKNQLSNLGFLALIYSESGLKFTLVDETIKLWYQRCSKLFQKKSALKQRWSALILFKSDVISAEILWDVNQGRHGNQSWMNHGWFFTNNHERSIWDSSI